MADFGSIYSLANHPTAPPPDPATVMHNMLSIQQLGQQVQMGQLQGQQLQQQLQDAQRVRQTIQQAAQGAPDTDTAMTRISGALQKDGSPTALKYLENITAMQKQGVELTTAKQALIDKHLSMLGDRLGASQTPQDAVRNIQSFMQNGAIPQAQGADLLTGLQQVASPEDFKTWKLTRAMELHASKELISALTPKTELKDMGTSMQSFTTDPLTGKVTPGPVVGEMDLKPDALKQYAANFPDGLNEDGSVNLKNPHVAAKARAMETNMAMIMGGGAAGGGHAFDPSQPLNPADESQARWAAQTGQRETPSLRNPGALQRNARAEFLAQNGGGSIAENKATFSANSDSLKNVQKQRDQLVTFENTALRNLDTFLAAARQVQDSGSPLLNKPIRDWAGSVQGSPEQAVYNAARQVVIPEFAKINQGALNGVLSDSARQEVGHLIPQDATLGQIVATANLLKQDAANRHIEFDRTLQDIRGRMASPGSPGASGAPARWQDQPGASLNTPTAPGSQRSDSSSQAPAIPQANPDWGLVAPVGNPDPATAGKNPRFPYKSVLWQGKGAPQGAGWYLKENGMIRRVE